MTRRLCEGKDRRMSRADEAVGLVRDGGLDNGAGMHVAQGKAAAGCRAVIGLRAM